MITVKYWIVVDKGWHRVDRNIQEAWIPQQIEVHGLHRNKTSALRAKRRCSWSKRLEVAQVEMALELNRLETGQK